MSLASSLAVRADEPLFGDGLGERTVAADAATGELLQILRLHPALTAVPSFEFAIRERTARLANFRHAYYARVRRVDRLQDGSLAIVSDYVDGTRLSELLRAAQEGGARLDVHAALCLIRQLVPAVALLHDNVRDASHGLIAPERLIVTPSARLVVVEHVAGSAVEQLHYGRQRLWEEFRAPVPSSAGVPRLDHRTDVNGIGITALSLILGRPLAREEFPHAIPALLMQARERAAFGADRPLPNAFCNWLARMLQIDVRRAFASAPEALAALDETLAGEPAFAGAPLALETFLSRHAAAGPRFPAVRQSHPAAVAAPPLPASAVPASCNEGPEAYPECVVSGAAVPPVPAPAGDALYEDRTEGWAQPDSDAGYARGAAAGSGGVFDEDEACETGAETGGGGDGIEDRKAGRQAWGAAPRVRTIAALTLAVVVIAGGLLGARLYSGSGELPAGTLVVQSSPSGVDVFIDGVGHGVTPARLSLPAGSHILELRGRGVPRVIPLEVPAGGQVSQYLEFADTPMTGMLVVHSQPAGAAITVDGVHRGVAPLTIEGLEPGDREVLLQSARGSSRHVVKVLAGTTVSLVAPVLMAPEGPISGWIRVTAPFTVEIHQAGRLIGTTDTDRIMIPAGRHVLEFANQALGYRESRTVQVLPGKVAAIPLDLPRGSVNINASPWAEVWIDGRSVGETPIGNLELTIGAYEIVFRHPQFGERRHAVSVTTAAPVRLSVTMKN